MKNDHFRINAQLTAVAIWFLVGVATPAADSDPEWKAGVASVAITPEESMWMAGYASRTKPSEGKVHDLYAKALSLEDPQGHRVVLLTTDLIGIPRELRDRVVVACEREYKLPGAALLMNASHTHCGPELRTSKFVLQGLSPERVAQGQAYFDLLEKRLVELVGRSLKKMSPAKLGYSHGRAGFAMNRRLKTERGFENRPFPDGPVDHDVPVLRIDDGAGKPRAILFGYACHNTTLSFQLFCGDYAGFAQAYLEESNPGVTALFMAGCGADQNPQPRGTVELAQDHGRALANGVMAALLGPIRPIHGPLRAVLDETTLEFADPPTRGELEKLARSSDSFDRRRAEALLSQLNDIGRMDTEYAYPIQVIRFGDDLVILALAGEVVVDYPLRFKHEFANGPPLWVAGYSNDVFGYVPSLRVLQEGGYEAGGAMRFTTLPGPFAPSIEQRISSKVHDVMNRAKD